MVGSSILLGAAFIAVGYLVSALVRERGTAGGIAIGIWLVFVLIYDMALLGLLVVDQGQTLSGGLLNALLLLNPTDAYRLFNLTRLRQRQRVLRHGRGRAERDLEPVRPPRRAGRLGPRPARRSRRSPSPGESYEKDRSPRWPSPARSRSPAATTRRPPTPRRRRRS